MRVSAVVSPLLGAALVTLACAGCDGDDSDSGGPAAKRTTTEVTVPSSQRAQQFAARTSAQCLSVRRGATLPRTPRDPRRLRSYARRMLPVTVVTLGKLQELNPPAQSRRSVARMEQALRDLAGLYQRAAASRGSRPELDAIRLLERTVEGHAATAGIRACAPSGS